MHRAGILPEHFSVTPSQLAPVQRAKKSPIFFHPTYKDIFVLEISLCLGCALQEEWHSLTMNRNVSLQGWDTYKMMSEGGGWALLGPGSLGGVLYMHVYRQHSSGECCAKWCQSLRQEDLYSWWGAGVTYGPFSFLWPFKEAAGRWMMPASCACHFQSGMGRGWAWWIPGEWVEREEPEGQVTVWRHDRSVVDEGASPWRLQEIWVIRGWWMPQQSCLSCGDGKSSCSTTVLSPQLKWAGSVAEGGNAQGL